MNRKYHIFQRGYDKHIHFSEQTLIRIFAVFNDITFVNFVAEFEPTETSKKLLQLNNEFAELKEFQWNNRLLCARLIEDGINKEIMDKIKEQYLDAIKGYFQLIENKAEEFKYFETYCDSYARKLEKEKRRNAYPTPIVHFHNYLDKIAVYLRTLRVEINQLVHEEQQRQDNAVEAAPAKTKILFLTANPKNEVHLGLEREVRKVMNTLNGATNRQGFELISEPAVGIPDITKAMQRKPEIVHFSGHGNTEGLAVENDSGYSDLFPIAGLDRLFRVFKETTKCVILNACDSKELAKTISKHGIHVIGMNDEIGDEAARKFAVGFYQSLGEGNNYEFAFEVGMIHISNEYDDVNIPELWLNGKPIKN